MSAENLHSSVQAAVSPSVLRDIEGLNADEHGFCRSECCTIPEKMSGSFKPLLTHVFVPTALPTTEWQETCKNIPSFNEVQAEAKKSLPQCTVTVFHTPGAVHKEGPAESCVVVRRGAADNDVSLREVPVPAVLETMAQWKDSNVALESGLDRSNETMIFVCSHRLRDARCGYCGPVLVDLLNKRLAGLLGEERLIRAYACSHVGGHTYAGNVLVYTRNGGVCFGCFCPSDVEALVQALTDSTIPFPLPGTIPASLQPKVRGELTLKP